METLFISIISGLIATIISVVYTHHKQKQDYKYNYKMKVFQELIAYRSDITIGNSSAGNFQVAINQVFVAYNDCPKVLDNFEKFRRSVQSNDCSGLVIDNLLSLLKSMADELNIDYSFSNDTIFTVPIIVKKDKRE